MSNFDFNKITQCTFDPEKEPIKCWECSWDGFYSELIEVKDEVICFGHTYTRYRMKCPKCGEVLDD